MLGIILSEWLVNILYRYLKALEILSPSVGAQDLKYYQVLVDKLVGVALVVGNGTVEIVRGLVAVVVV